MTSRLNYLRKKEKVCSLDLKSYIHQAEALKQEHKALVESGVKEYSINYYYEASW